MTGLVMVGVEVEEEEWQQQKDSYQNPHHWKLAMQLKIAL